MNQGVEHLRNELAPTNQQAEWHADQCSQHKALGHSHGGVLHVGQPRAEVGVEAQTGLSEDPAVPPLNHLQRRRQYAGHAGHVAHHLPQHDNGGGHHQSEQQLLEMCRCLHGVSLHLLLDFFGHAVVIQLSRFFGHVFLHDALLERSFSQTTHLLFVEHAAEFDDLG